MINTEHDSNKWSGRAAVSKLKVPAASPVIMDNNLAAIVLRVVLDVIKTQYHRLVGNADATAILLSDHTAEQSHHVTKVL